MGNLMKRIALPALALFFLAGCGAKIQPQPKRPTGNNPQASKLSGVIYGTSGQMIDLSMLEGNVVLLFSGYLCEICKVETQEFVAHFARMPSLPRNVHLITVITDGTREEAAAWKASLGVPWTVAVDDTATPDNFDDDNAIFFQNCPTRQTPCTVTYNETSRQFRRFFRKVGVGEVEGETGPWVY